MTHNDGVEEQCGDEHDGLRCVHTPGHDGLHIAASKFSWPRHNDGPLLCDNCGKTMVEHDALAHCWGPESKTFTSSGALTDGGGAGA